MNEEKFYELVVKHLSKETSKEESDQLNSLIKEESYNNIYRTICEQWGHVDDYSESSNFDIERGLNKLAKKIRNHEPAFNWGGEKKKIFILQPTFLKVAASIAFFIILATGALYTFGIFDQKPVAIVWNEKTTKMGEKYIVTLFDGTNITLNADSKLKYPARFGENSREVYLEGEAFFEVQHDAKKPFVVRSGDISTTDIGTKFNISAFPEEKNIEVSLIEGSVKVSANNSGSQKGDVILEPTQQLVYNKENETNKVKTFDDQKTTGWKDNVFVFDNEPLSKVFVELERSFGVKFELTDKSYGNKKIKANFKNASLWTITEVIKKATRLQYKTIKENNETKRIVFFKK